ncbi:MAG: hypothetical protein R3F60_29360 [bacterium]
MDAARPDAGGARALLGTLGAWRPAEGGGIPARPGLLPWIMGHGAALFVALPIALALADRLAETIAPDLRTPVIVVGTLAVAGLLAPLAPTVASLAAGFPERLRLPPALVAAGFLVLGLGSILVLGGTDARLDARGLGVAGAAAAWLGGRRARRCAALDRPRGPPRGGRQPAGPGVGAAGHHSRRDRAPGC